MKYINHYIILLLLLSSLQLFAQPKPTAMADLMRSEGRIYVVIAVLLTILAGIFLYLYRLEKKLKKVEKE